MLKHKHNIYYKALKNIEKIVKGANTIDPFTFTERIELLKNCAILWNIVNLSMPCKPCASYKGIGKCYRCNNDVKISEKFCPNCCQALDWSDE